MRFTVQQMRAAGIVLLFWSSWVSPSVAQNAPPSPDVVLVTIDTLRADHVACYGYKGVQTPALDSLAREGIRFTNAFSASPITNSSHATILTGLYPSSHGVTDFGVPLDRSHLTLATLLKERGYRTAAFVGAVILDSKQLAPGFDAGFDYYDNFAKNPGTTSRFGRLERRGKDVVQRAQKWLAANTSAPRFIWVHLYDPHDPYEPPPPYSATYKDHLYDGEIAYADSALADLLLFLRHQGRYNNSLIIAVGDHGEGLGEHNEQTHGIFLYDSTTHVPLIAKLPAAAHAGRVITTQVRTVDIVPTILDIVSTTQQRSGGKFDGRSLAGSIQSGEASDEPAISQTDYPLRFGWAPLRSLRANGSKFIEAPRPELYDLRSDPGETHNIYEPWNDSVKNARSTLAKLARPTNTAQAGAVPKTTVDELRALGYLGPEGATNVPEVSLLPDPKDKIEIQNLLHSAMMAAEDGQTSAARDAFLKAVQADPNSAIAFSQLGQLELKSGDYPQAATHLLKAHELRPEDAATAMYLGEAQEKAGNLAAARDAYQSSLKIASGQATVRAALGRVYLRMNQPKAAIEQFEAAAFVQPDNAEIRAQFGRALLANSEFDKAAEQLEQATRLQPTNREALLLLQSAYERLGKRDLARRAAQRASALPR